jgi:hypothetical protein
MSEKGTQWAGSCDLSVAERASLTRAVEAVERRLDATVVRFRNGGGLVMAKKPKKRRRRPY